MNRGKKAAYNMMASASLQIVTLLCSFIMPRLILTNFGSSYNGITSSVSQFLQVISLLRAGIGGATHAALYKSLAKNDIDQTSATILATEKFMRKVALIFAVFILTFSCTYPLLVNNEFEFLFTASLVLIISASTFIQYFFGITYQMLLRADQREYVFTIVEIVATILNTILSVILINSGFGVHAVRLGSAFIFCLSPLTINLYTRHHYKLRRNIAPDYSVISQRWDAFFHQVAAFVHNNTDIILLTFFADIKEVSVYSIYYLVGHGLRKIISIISTGIDAAFGNMLAKKEMDTLQKNLDLYELMTHLLASVLFGAALILITPFVSVYTSGITDVNYIRYYFGYLVIISELLYCLRNPYKSLIHAAGHFKQTKKYAFIEAIINFILSFCLVVKYGLVGVTIGTLASIVYLNIVYAQYSCSHIIERSILKFAKRFFITGLCTLLIALLPRLIPAGEITNYLQWVIYAVKITGLAVIITFGLNMAFYGKLMIALIRKIKDIISSVIHRR